MTASPALALALALFGPTFACGKPGRGAGTSPGPCPGRGAGSSAGPCPGRGASARVRCAGQLRGGRARRGADA